MFLVDRVHEVTNNKVLTIFQIDRHCGGSMQETAKELNEHNCSYGDG